jgi:hypothetical protein
MITFGDVFQFREKQYVFLAKTEEIIYAAEIHDQQTTDKFVRLYEIKDAQNKINPNSLVFCFVILQTTDFKDRMAHLGNTAKNELVFEEVIGKLESKDLEELKEQILLETSAVPLQLKTLIRDIVITDTQNIQS